MQKAFLMLSDSLKALLKERGFNNLTPPQEKAIPLILNGENILIVAPTGTGKTEAAILPVLEMMLKYGAENGINLIYITPLRALNRDLLDRIEWWFRRFNFKVSVRHGDTAKEERRLQAISPPKVLITTPETLQILFLGKKLKRHLTTVRWIIVDEVHELASSKRGSQLSVLLERLKGISKYEIQIIGLSATIGNPYQIAEFLRGSSRPVKVVYVPVAKRIEVKVEYPTITKEDIELSMKFGTPPEVIRRLRLIKDITLKSRSALIFTNTRPMAELLSSRFRLIFPGLPIFVHHGSLSVATRTRAEESLKTGKIKALIATSSMELGIDVGQIDIVIQYNSPRQVSKLIQRIGRSGHKIEKVSKGVVIVQNTNDALEALVLKRLLEDEKIEPVIIPMKPIDVLAHELISLLISEKFIEVERAYKLFKDSYPFKELTHDYFQKLLAFMSELNLIKVIAGKVSIKDKTYVYNYFYSNLSMIPEVKQYLVINDNDNLPVGILDEYFVASYCEPEVKFIMSGYPWKVVQVFNDTVRVIPENDFTGAIPSWVGEEIPVPFEVARRVGEIRRKVKELFEITSDIEWISKKIAEENNWKISITKEAIKDVYEMAKNNIPIPSDKLIVIEELKDMIVIHAHFGNKVNRALGKYIAYKYNMEVGGDVLVSEKPYNIALRIKHVNGEVIEDILKRITVEDFKQVLRSAIINSKLFEWRLTQVARRMGIISSKSNLTKSSLERLVLTLRNTPPYYEALKEVFNNDLNLEKSIKVIQMINDGEIKIARITGPTPITEQIMIYLRNKLHPLKSNRDAFLLSIFKSKIMQERVSIGCTSCLNYVEEKYVYEIKDQLICPYCGSREIVIDKTSENELYKKLNYCFKGKGKRGCRKLRKLLELYKKYGTKFVYAYVANIPLNKMSSILNKEYRSNLEFFKVLFNEHRKIIMQTFLNRDKNKF